MSNRGQFDIMMSRAPAFAAYLRDFEALPKKARKRVLSTLSRRLLTEARRDIQREYAIKAGTVKERLHISHKFDLVRLVGKGSGLNLMHFGAKQNRKGVSYRVKKTSGRETRPHAFIRKTHAGDGPFVWMRASAATLRNNHYRGYFAGDRHGYPILQQYGPSVAQMLKHGRRPERLADFAGRVFAKEITRLAVREQEKLAEKALRRR